MTHPSWIHDPMAPIRRALVRPPDTSFAVDDPVAWGYAGRPDLERARAEHSRLVELLIEEGVDVIHHRLALEDKADAIFVFDPVLMTRRGAILLRMGKPRRVGEERVLGQRLEELGIPVLGRLGEGATAEGGDLLRLDASTLLVGVGLRTNTEGARQIGRLLAPQAIDVEAFDLPYHQGPGRCLHLRSLVSPIDVDLVVAYRPLLPARLVERFERRGQIIDVPATEFERQGPNVLALGGRRCLVLEGSPETRRRLEAAGCRVVSYRGEEISLKAEGGPTCLVLPLWRSASVREGSGG